MTAKKVKPKTKPKTGQKKTGRPKIVVDFAMVENMCAIHCTGEEIANILGISYDTLVRAIKKDYGLSFAEYFAIKSAKGKVSLRRKQWELATDGDRAMLIRLGELWLGQGIKEVESNEEQEKFVYVTSSNRD